MKPIIAAIFVCWAVNVKGQGSCVKLNSCSCSYSNNAVIDLSPLAFNNGTPRWSELWDTYYSSRYSYNPCFAFNDSTCVNASVCRFDGVEHLRLGSQDSAQFIKNATTGHPIIIYNSTDNVGVTRIIQLELICITEGPDVLNVIGELDRFNYETLRIR